MKLKPVSPLNYVRCAKSAFADLNAKLIRPAFLELHFPNATFSNVESMPLLRDMKPTSLQLNEGPRKPAFLKRC